MNQADLPTRQGYSQIKELDMSLRSSVPFGHTLALVASVMAAAIIQGCHAKEAPTSGFIDKPELMARNTAGPFNRAYWNHKYEPKNFTEIMIAPVNTQYVMAQSFWEKASTSGLSPDQAKKDVQSLADYTRQSMTRAFSNDPKHRFKVVENAGPETLILELALTQVVPSKAALNAIGYVSWIPTMVAAAGSTITESQDTGKGVVAIEGRIRNGGNDEIIGLFQDRQNPPTAIVDLKAVSWWAPAKQIVDNWATDLVAVANRPPGGIVKPAPAFQLLVW
jgi:hypothetical protein